MAVKVKWSILFLLLAGSLFGQSYQSKVEEGNAHFRKGAYDKAEIAYRSALRLQEDGTEATYNLANALLKQGRVQEAETLYRQLLGNSNCSEEVKSKVHHNLGNIEAERQAFDKAVKEYKSSLRLKPDDEETRQNLAKSLRQLQQQQQQQQQQKQQDQKQEDEKEEEQKPDPQQDQKEDDQQQNQKGDSDSGKDQNEKSQGAAGENDLSKEEAERLLEALAKQEEDTREKVEKKKSGSAAKPEKDW